MDRIRIVLHNAQQGHQEITRIWPTLKAHLLADRRLRIEVSEEKRSTAQNSLMWSALGDLAAQVNWHGQKLCADDWKDMATAALKRHRVVPGLDGGFVVLGQRTSKMTKAEMTELIDFIHAIGDQRGVQWSRTSVGRDWPDEVAA